jgi:hypothetical protein
MNYEFRESQYSEIYALLLRVPLFPHLLSDFRGIRYKSFGECRANGRKEGCTVVMGLLLTNTFISLYTNICLGLRQNAVIILNSNLPHYALWLVMNFSASLRMDKNVSLTTFSSEAAFQVQINVTLLSSLRLIQPCESMAEFPRLVMHKHCSPIFVTTVTKRVFYCTKVDRDLNS